MTFSKGCWSAAVLESTQGIFPPSDDGIQNEKPVKRYAPVSFPQYGTFKDADPRVTHDVTLRVPTRALTSREHGLLVLRLASDSLKTVTLKVGREEFTGIEVDEITQERGNATVTQMVGLSGSIIFDTETIGNLSIDVPNNKTLVGMIVKIFEDDTPPQHMWMPSPNSPKYRVLWSKQFAAEQ